MEVFWFGKVTGSPQAKAGHQESHVSLMCSVPGWEQPVGGVVSAVMQGWISGQSSGGPWPTKLPGDGGLQGALSWLLHVRKEYFKPWTRVRKMGSAGVWTDYSFHRVARVGITEKVIVEPRFGGEGEGPSDVISIIMLTSLCSWSHVGNHFVNGRLS